MKAQSNVITIWTPTFDPLGYVRVDTLEPGTDLSAVRRRVSRTATLDGGAVINDSGYTAADRTLSLRFAPNTPAATIEALRRIAKIYSTVFVALFDGCFLATPQDVSIANGEATMTLLISEALREVV